MHWSHAPIGDFMETVEPGFASGANNKAGVGVAHLRPMNVSRLGSIDLTELKFVPPDKSDRRLKSGDVLFNNTNSPPPRR